MRIFESEVLNMREIFIASITYFFKILKINNYSP